MPTTPLPVTPPSYLVAMETMRTDSPVWAVEHPVDEYVRVCREITMLQAHAADLLGQIDRDRSFEVAGYLTSTAFVRDTTGVSGTEARRRVIEARGLVQHDTLREAFTSAAIDRPRVSMLLRAAGISPELFDRDESVLVNTIAGLSVADARRIVEYWCQAADQEAAATNERHLINRRRLSISDTYGGMVRLDGDLDPESGYIVLTAIRSLVEPTQLDPSDTRSLPQRRADALVDLCNDHLEHGDTPVSGGIRPHLTLVVSPEVLATGVPGWPCELDGTVITPATAQRIACDASVTEIDDRMSAGRASRTIPTHIRRALIHRDGGCTHPGCDRPHRWCDAHHIVHWADGGPTRVDNLRLLCRRHHRMAHDQAPYPIRE